LTRAGDRAGATRTLIEEATALRHGGRVSDAEHITGRAVAAARRDGDHAALADVYLLVAAHALDRRDATAAMSAAQSARAEALAANAPTSYIGASHAIAQLAESAGDRLATGWVILGDLLGADLARMSFEPKLKELRERWGVAAFDAVKKSYEAQRRRAGSGRTGPVG
jgi:hypothetical protein